MEVTKKLRPGFLWICAIFIENMIPIGSVYVNTPYHFKSQNFGNGGYQNNLVEETVYIGQEGLHLLLNITYIETESCCDFLAIGSGNIIGGNTTMTVSGGPYINELRYLSEGNTIWMRFTTNQWTTSNGYRGIVQPVNITSDASDFDCGKEFNCQNGACIPTVSRCDSDSRNQPICANNKDWELMVISDVWNVTARRNITSYNYDTRTYPCNLQQEEIYIAPVGFQLLLTIEYFYTEYEDYLRVGNGNVSNERNILTYDGGKFINEIRVLSEEDVMWLTFTSDSRYSYHGFSGFVEPVTTTLDELDCGNDFDCQNGACISPRSVCDYRQNCANGFDNAGATVSDIYNVTSRHNVTSHNYDTGTYLCNLYQEEVYIAPDGLHLLLTIEYFNTEYDDYLRVGNGNVTNERNILLYDQGQFFNEIRVLSEENIMWLTFTSDSYYSYDGFSGFVEPVNMTLDELDCGNEFDCQNGACISPRSVCDYRQNCANGFDNAGATVSDIYNVTSRHNVTSHNYDTGTYLCNLYQEEVYIAPDGLHLLLTIESFNTENGDYLRVGNGNVTNERNILMYDQGPFYNEIRVLSEENIMWLTFQSDSYYSYDGFSGFVEPVNMTLDELDCGNDFNCKNGACISQRSVCDNRYNCANGFDTPGAILSDIYNVTSRHNVKSHNNDTGSYLCNLYQEEVYIAPDGLHLLLTVEYFYTYYGDYLRVGNGNVTNERNILLYDRGPFYNEIRVLSEENIMWLTFITDHDNNVEVGFSGFVEPVNMTLEELHCGNEFNCQNGACIPHTSTCNDNRQNCANDVDRTGVTMSDVWSITTLRNITSDNFANKDYPCNLVQEQVFYAPDGLRLLLTVDYLQTGYFTDILRVGNGNITTEGHILKYSGGPFNDEIKVLSETNVMWLRFTTDNNYNGGGFSGFIRPVSTTVDELDCENQFNCLNGACIAQSSVCDNEENCANGLDTSVSLSETTYVNTSYSVSSYMFDSGGYPCKLQQEEFFIAPDGLNILLTIEYLFTEALYDVLRIGNGNDIRQGLLREYSGGPFVNEIEILSEGTMMWLTLLADGSVNSIGFRGFVKSVNATADTLPCAEPHPPDELVSHIPDLPDGELYPNGTEIMYECPDGWNLNGNTKAVCLYGMWTNENAFCSEILPTMCPFQSLSFSGVQLTFRATDPGSRVNSIQNCSEESSNAYQPLAMRFCDEDGWEEPVLTSCYTPEDAADVVERIANTTVTEENVNEVASDLALVTTQTEDLDVSQVEDVAESLRDIANVNSSSPEVTESVVGTVNNLMEVNERSLEQTVGTSSVIVSLEQQISNVQKNPNNFTDVQHNVGVQAVKLDPDITKAVTFINLPPSNTTGRDAVNADLAEENARLYNDKQEVRTDNSTTSIYVPSMILELALEVDPTITHVPISFFIYKDSRLFQTSKASSTSAPEKDRSKNRQEIASQVIAATLEVANVVIKDLPPENSIVTRFTIAPPLGQNEVVKEEKCVFWSVSEEGNGGTWSAEGCTLTKDKNQTVCTCNHLTSFAVLVGIGSDLPEALSIITVVGSSLSISGLILCISSLSLIGGLRTKQASQIHLNLCLCLLAFYVVFLVGDFVIDKPRHCNNIATTIHYLCLTTVAWMSVEALHMYLLFVKFKTPKLFQLKLKYFVSVSAVSVYGLCLIPVLSVLFLSSQEVDGYCFLPSGQGLLFGLILEVLVMILFNLVVFSLLLRNIVFRPIMPSNAKRYKKKEMFSRLQQFVVFWFLLGMSWIFGFFAMIPNRESVVFEYLFCLFTSLQGFFLFIFICLKNPEVVNRFKKTREYLSEWSNEKNKSSLKTLRTGESNSTQRAAQSSEL